MAAPIVAAVSLQLLSYYTAKEKDFDIDKPRNLAKSVTVEQGFKLKYKLIF